MQSIESQQDRWRRVPERAAGLDRRFSSGEARLAGVEVPDFVFFSGHGDLAGVQGRNSFLLRPRPAWPEVPAARTIKNQKQHTVHQLSG